MAWYPATVGAWASVSYAPCLLPWRSAAPAPVGRASPGLGEQGSFELLVLRNTVIEEQWERRFAGGRFVMEEAFGVLEELFGESREIQAGSYPVEVRGNYLHIC